MTQTAEPAATEGIRRVRTEPNQRRVRVFFGGEAVADSSSTIYLFETGHLPVYYFPPRRRPVRPARAHQPSHPLPVQGRR